MILERFFNRSKRRVPNILRNVSKSMQSIFRNYLSHPFQYYFLKSFKKVFEIFLVLFKGILIIFQEIFLPCFANFMQYFREDFCWRTGNVSWNISKMILEWFLNRSKRRVPNIWRNVSKTLQSDIRNYNTTICRIVSSIISWNVLKRFLIYF